MLFQRQQCQRAAIEKAFAGGVLVGNRVFGAEHDDRAAEIVHIGGNAELAARLRQTAVGRHQQFGGQRVAVFQFHQSAVFVGFHAFHAHAATQFHIRHLRHFFISRAADVVVGNQVAQTVGFAAACFGRFGEMQRVIRSAVIHFRIAQAVNLVFGNALPHAQMLHNFARTVRQGDFATVVCRILQAFQRCFFDNGNPQAAVFELSRKRQTCGAGAHH